MTTNFISPSAAATFVRDHLPVGGLFAGHTWRVSPTPLPLGKETVAELETLGRVLLQFYRAINLLYRKSVEGKQPPWVAALLDQGKPAELLQLQRAAAFKHDVPRVIRPDLLLTEAGLGLVELDSVPGGIGLTAWLNQTYAAASPLGAPQQGETPAPVLGGADGMIQGFKSIFGDAPRVQLVISDEAATYRPEMEWLAGQIDPRTWQVRGQSVPGFPTRRRRLSLLRAV